MLEYCMDIDQTSTFNPFVTMSELQKNLPFCPISVGHYLAKEKYFTKRDKLQNYLLIVTTGGLGEIKTTGERYLLEKGSAVVIDCNEYHEYNTKKGHDWEFYWVHFQPLNFQSYHERLIKNLTCVTLRNPVAVEGFMRDLHALSFTPNPLNYLQQSNLLSNVLTEMVCSLEEGNETKKTRMDVEKLQSFIRQNFKKELHLDDFIKEINLSKHHLIRLFEKETGITPYRFLHLCRIQRAQILLKSTEKSVTEIAYEVGYNDVTVFIRRFKSFTSFTPLAYRNKPVQIF